MLLICAIYRRDIGEISEEQSAIFDDYRLHYFCTILYIINQSKRFHTFVANRPSVIHDNSATCQWRHVSSELNPADEISRGLTVDEMRTNSKWLNAPQFLRKKKERWPRDPTVNQPELSDDDPEIKRDSQSYSQSLTHHRSADVSADYAV